MKRILVLASILIFSCSGDPQNCDILIENGIIYDGTGDKPYKGVVAISNDKIVYVGKNKNFVADKVIDATDKAVSPGFINMLSWADKFRDQIAGLGISLIDHKNKTLWMKKEAIKSEKQ